MFVDVGAFGAGGKGMDIRKTRMKAHIAAVIPD